MPRPRLFAARAAALALAACATLSWAQNASKASQHYEDALKRYDKRDLAGAIIQLKNALQADKGMLPVHLLLSQALLESGQPAAAEFQFGEALRLGVNRSEVVVPLASAFIAQGKQAQMLEDPRLAPGDLPPDTQRRLLLERALAYSDIGNAKAALAAVREARAINPSDPTTWIAEVPLRIRAQQMAEAQAAADQAVKLAPDNAEAVYQKASVAHAMGQIQAALALYDRAIQLNASHGEARVGRAGILTDLRRDADALAEVKELQRLLPKDPRGVYLRAVIADRAGDAKTSKAALKEITDLIDPVPLDYIRYRTQFLIMNGLAHFGLGEMEKAKPFLELAAKQQPNSPLNKLLAQIALSENNGARAVELLDGYVQLRPNDPQALLLLAQASMSVGKHARAAQLMQDAIKARDLPEYRTALGISLLQGGQGALAATELEKAYKADPNQTYAGLALVALQLRAGDVGKAVAVANNLAKTNPRNPTVLLTQAYARQMAGDVAGSRASYENALVFDPKSVPAQLGLARLDATSAAYDAALQRLKALLKSNERNPDVLFELALLHEQWGKDAEALSWLEKAALASSSRDTRANFALVKWHLTKGSPAAAFENAKQLLAKLPEDVEALQAYAAAQLANGDQAGAKASLTNAARRASFDAPRLVEIARQQIDARDLPGAAYSLEKALSASPELLSAQAMMASVELARGETANSERRARQIQQANPKSALGANLLAEVAMSRGQTAAAVDLLKQAHAIDKSANSLTRLMRAQASQTGAAGVAGQKAAADLADAWLKRNPADAFVRNTWAELLVRAGDYAGARKQYEAVLKLKPNDLAALNNLANTLIALKDGGAVDVAERALKLDARSPVVLSTAGWAQLQAGNSERAVLLLRDARLRAPNNPEIRYFLGAALAKAGKTGEAKQELGEAVRAGSTFAGAADAKRLLATLN